MKTQRQFNKLISFVALFGFFPSLVVAQNIADMIEPPKVNLVDPFGVNVSTGQVTVSLDTVSIGGERGLSHGISGHTNNFSMTGWRGNNDRYQGAVKFKDLGQGLIINGITYNDFFHVLSVFGPGGSEDFKFMINGGQVSPYPPTNTINYYYEALGDTRNKLEVSLGGSHLDWTTPDGTIYRYRRYSQTIRSEGELEEIIYPNGFTIYRHGFKGVSTNTGYQIKYAVVDDNRTAPSSVCGATERGPSSQLYCNSQAWANTNPSRFIAINNTVESCPFSGSCDDLEQDWPTANILWPAGMPKAIFVGDNDVEITNAEGEKTILHFQAQDLRIRDPQDPNPDELLEVVQDNKFSARLMGVTPPGATERVYEYEYFNSYFSRGGLSCQGEVMCTWRWWVDTPQGIIKNAKGPNGNASYSIQEDTAASHEKTNISSWGDGYIHALVRVTKIAPGTLVRADINGEGRYVYGFNGAGGSTDFRNFVSKFYPHNVSSQGPGPSKEYSFNEITHNLESVASNGSASVSARYDTVCNNYNRKFCNKPTSVTDQNGNTTDYTYHEQSGQIKTVTRPADDYGQRPKVTYEYDQRYATFMDPDTGQVVNGSPIWLKVEEKFCRTQSADANGNCILSGDQVRTTFDYGPQNGSLNNLHLREITVVADGETRRTCYEYDIYGNQIGETKPKANKQSCY